MNIIIPLETASRELLYKVYLCNQLALKGGCCYLGKKTYITFLIKNLRGYTYLDKGYHKGTSEKIYEVVRQNGGIIVNLDDEGAVDYSDGSTLLGRYSNALFVNADLTFLWGNKQYELVKNNMINENKIHVTGHPRFELLKPEFQYLYKEEVDEIKKHFKEFYLINTNMSFGNNIEGDEFVRTNYRERFKHIDRTIAFDKMKLESFRLLVVKLSEKLNKTIVLRPHPEENRSVYEQAFANLENVKVIYEGSVVPWIIAAELMIHPDCTTAIESLFLGKIPISYLPHDYPKDLVTQLPLKASNCYVSQSELIKYMENNIKNKSQVDLIDYPFAEEYFSISKPTLELISNHIEKTNFKSVNKSEKLISPQKLFTLKLKNIIRNISVRKHAPSLAQNKLKGFSLEKIQKINNKIAKNNSEFRQVKCKKMIDQLYLFTT